MRSTWVLTLPHELRGRAAYDGKVFSEVSRLFTDSVLGWYRRRLADEGAPNGRGGAVVVKFTQRRRSVGRRGLRARPLCRPRLGGGERRCASESESEDGEFSTHERVLPALGLRRGFRPFRGCGRRDAATSRLSSSILVAMWHKPHLTKISGRARDLTTARRPRCHEKGETRDRAKKPCGPCRRPATIRLSGKRGEVQRP
jgi:hypothetical protein